MTEADTLFLRVALGSASEMSFASFDELKAWYNQEKSFFTGLLSSRLNNSNNVRLHLNQRWRNLDSRIEQAQQMIRREQDPAGMAGELRQAIQQLYQHGDQPLFLSNSPQASFLLTLHSQDADDAAAALCLLLKQPVDPQQTSTYRGAVALAMFEKGMPDSAEHHRSALEQVYRDGTLQVSTFKEEAARLQQDIDRFSQSVQELLTSADGNYQELHSEHAAALEKSLEETREALANHEQTYSEKLALHSAVQYWKRQEKRRARQGISVGVGFAISLVAAAYLLFYFSERLLSDQITPQKIAAILLTVSPIFWGLRLLARLLLSYMHLGTDAAERQVLIETYLALHKEGKVADEDREFLLAAVFRPASTGIVRDDAAPTWSDMFSKLSGK